MLGFAPLAAIPLAATLAPPVVTTVEMAGTASLTFTSSGTLGQFVPMEGSASLSFTPSATLYVDVLLYGNASLTFTNEGTLYLAGDPITFDMVPAVPDFRGNWRPAEFDMKPTDLTFRGVKQ